MTRRSSTGSRRWQGSAAPPQKSELAAGIGGASGGGSGDWAPGLGGQLGAAVTERVLGSAAGVLPCW